MPMIVWVSCDAPSIALAFAWKLRCADISITSSSVISTFDRSSAPERTAPIEPLVGPSIVGGPLSPVDRSEEHTSELQSLMRTSYAVFCLNKKKQQKSNKSLVTTTKTKSHNTKPS